MSSSEGGPAQFVRRPLDGDEIADLQLIFDECDADGDQRIGFTEYFALLERLGSNVQPGQRRRHFEAIDSDHDGSIDRREFMDWLRSV